MSSFSEQDLLALRDQHEPWLRSLPGVVGTGIGMDKSGRISLKLYSNHLSPETRQQILQRLGDVPLAIEETGEIRKQ